jgi:two-component system LytT family response regulator
LLREHCDTIEVIGVAETVDGAVSILSETTPDLVIMDIELKDGSGMDVLAAFNPIPWKVIFITGRRKYAHHSFKYQKADFLLKPVGIDELVSTVNKVLSGEPNGADQNLNGFSRGLTRQ